MPCPIYISYLITSVFPIIQAEMDVLSKTQKDLNQGKQKLEQIIADLEKEKVSTFHRHDIFFSNLSK